MIKAKKNLGQNFLIDEKILKKITDITEIKGKTILEVGPGTGNLSSFILKKNPKKFFVVEKDHRLISSLQKKFQNQIEIINGDILKIDEKELSQDKLIVFGNLPYNISTEILCKWILNLNDNNFWFENMILMFQKEVADRIVAEVNSSKYGRLTILTNWKMKAKRIFDIDPENFFPKPKVKSSLIYFEPRKDYFTFKSHKNLETVTNVFFQNRRKMIKKPINILFKNFQFDYKKFNIKSSDRPQNIDIKKYLEIVNEYESLGS